MRYWSRPSIGHIGHRMGYTSSLNLDSTHRSTSHRYLIRYKLHIPNCIVNRHRCLPNNSSEAGRNILRHHSLRSLCIHQGHTVLQRCHNCRIENRDTVCNQLYGCSLLDMWSRILHKIWWKVRCSLLDSLCIVVCLCTDEYRKYILFPKSHYR